MQGVAIFAANDGIFKEALAEATEEALREDLRIDLEDTLSIVDVK